MTSTSTTESPARRGPQRSMALWCAALFAGLLALFHANASVLEEGDAVPSLVLPLSIVKYGALTFDPERWPEMFQWETSPPLPETRDFFFRHWSVKYAGKTAREL